MSGIIAIAMVILDLPLPALRPGQGRVPADDAGGFVAGRADGRGAEAGMLPDATLAAGVAVVVVAYLIFCT
ncbi:MAG: hypothetical protein H0T75_00840 [Rhizobiales bacterium]|jgi:hypothetical protein|nr:hypothetical protein [Hyphomicrobiales bacterium]